jgi:HK97 gp10 family phage protein
MATNNVRVQGLAEAKAAFRALPDIIRDAMNVATETTASEIVRHAKDRIVSSPSVRTRSLLNAIAYTINRKTGVARAGVANVTTTLIIGGKKVRVKGIITEGKGGSALKSSGARIVTPSKYAKFVEFGTAHMPAEPFMIPAAETQKDPYLQRARAAGKTIEQKTAAIGMRHL